MKRLTTLALIVFALAAVPAALADDSAPAAPAGAAAAQQQNAGRGGQAAMRLEIMRLHLRIVQLRFRLHCSGGRNAERCDAFAQKVEDRLTTLDGNVQKKIAELKACTADSTDAACRNAARKLVVLSKLDEHLQKAIQKVQDWLDGKTTPADPSSDSSLDAAASALAGAGSNG